MTPNQIVAHNLKRAREHRALTQPEAAARLAEWIGTEWSAVSWSAAERSVTGKRVRQFSADEVAAFALAFDVPVSWFFVPPDECEGIDLGGERAVPLDEYSDVVAPEDDDRDVVTVTLTRHLLAELGHLATHRQAAEGLAELLKKLETVANVLSDRVEKRS